MSSQTIVLNTGQQAIINTDVSKIFVWDNRYEQAVYTNTTGLEVILEAGTVMGRISVGGEVVPLEAVAVDGSQFPIGILAGTVTVPDTESRNVYFCVSGDVAEEKLIFVNAETLDTIISGKILRDRIGSDTVGVKLVAATELTNFDNA